MFTGMDYNNRDQLYDQAKKSLRKFKGDQVKPVSKNSETIKFDPTFLLQHEETLAAAGYIPHSKFNKSKIKQNTTINNFNRKQSQQNRRNFNFHSERRMNPTGQNGKVLTCIACGSYCHLLNECPDSWENISKANYIETDDGRPIDNDSDPEPISPVLFNGNNENSLSLLVKEARNSAALDCACSSTVCEKKWLDCYLSSLSETERSKIKQSSGIEVFKFGGGKVLTSIASLELPGVLADRKVTIKTDVVTSDIPLLLSLETMKKAGVKLDLVNDSAEIFGKHITLNHTEFGHYCIPLNKDTLPIEIVRAVDINSMDNATRYKTLLKLHNQFAYPPASKLISLLKDANARNNEFHADIEKIS